MLRWRMVVRWIVVGCVLAAWGSGPTAAPAAAAPQEVDTTAIVVTTIEDELDADGDCSLREAVRAANLDMAVDACPAGSGADIVQLAAARYALTQVGTEDEEGGALHLIGGVTIQGAGRMSTTVSGELRSRIFTIAPEAEVRIADLTLAAGALPNPTSNRCQVGYGDLCPGENGGAVANWGILVLERVVLQDNHAGNGMDCVEGDTDAGAPECNGHASPGGSGGAIYNANTLTVTESLLIGNAAGDGGNCPPGTWPSPAGCLGGDGGHGGAIYNSARYLFLDRVEVVDNRAGNGGTVVGFAGQNPSAGSGGGIYSYAGPVVVVRSTVAGNRAGNGPQDLFWNYVYGEVLGGDGGGIWNRGDLWLVDSTLLDNQSGAASTPRVRNGYGGGLANLGAAVLRGTTVAGNRTPAGLDCYEVCWGDGGDGGIGAGIFNGGVLTATNSTVAANTTGAGGSPRGSGGDGGGIFNAGLFSVVPSGVGRLWLCHVTVSRNRSSGAGSDGSPGLGGGIAADGGEVHLLNTLLVENQSDRSPNCRGIVTSEGPNWVEPTGCSLVGSTDDLVLAANPLLWPLALYGGATPTLGLNAASPAVDAGDCRDFDGTLLTTDQRGYGRPYGAGCDLGAVEARWLPEYLPYVP